jgi:hypothetical protein
VGCPLKADSSQNGKPFPPNAQKPGPRTGLLHWTQERRYPASYRSAARCTSPARNSSFTVATK